MVDGRPLHYDYLVVATGSTDSYFGHDEWARYAPALKTLDDAISIRERILTSLAAYHDGVPLGDDIALVVVRCRT